MSIRMMAARLHHDRRLLLSRLHSSFRGFRGPCFWSCFPASVLFSRSFQHGDRVEHWVVGAETKGTKELPGREIVPTKFFTTNHSLYSKVERGLPPPFDSHTPTSSMIQDRPTPFNFRWRRHRKYCLPSRKVILSHKTFLPRLTSVRLIDQRLDTFASHCTPHLTLLPPGIVAAHLRVSSHIIDVPISFSCTQR